MKVKVQSQGVHTMLGKSQTLCMGQSCHMPDAALILSGRDTCNKSGLQLQLRPLLDQQP